MDHFSKQRNSHLTLLLALALTSSCAPEPTTVSSKQQRGSIDLARIVLHENSVPTIELGDDGTVVNLLSSRSEPIIQHRCGPQVLQAKFLRSNGQTETLISPVNYLLDITTDNEATAYFERWDRFTGNLKGRAVGTTRLNVTLILLADSTAVLGPFHIPVKVEQVDKDPC